MQVSSASVMGLETAAQKQKLRLKGPSTFLSANPSLKKELEKFEQGFKNVNIPEWKYIKPPKPHESVHNGGALF